MSFSTVLKYGLLSQGGAMALPTITWELKASVSSYALSSVAYGDEVWIICADRGCSTSKGYIRKSLDWGANWADSRVGGNDTSANAHIGTTWVNFVRCGEGGYNLVYSTNLKTGNTWATVKPNGQYHYNLWKAGNYLVGGNYNNYYDYSSNGSTWTSRRIAAVNSVAITNASYSSKFGYYYIAAQNNAKHYCMTALDGTGQAEVAALVGYYTCAGDNEVLAFVYNSSSATGLKRDSTNGTGFTETITTIPSYTNIAGIAYYEGIYFMTFYDSADTTRRVAMSYDGITWSESPVPTGTFQPYNGNSRIGAGYNSSDGKHYLMVIGSASTSILIGTFTL